MSEEEEESFSRQVFALAWKNTWLYAKSQLVRLSLGGISVLIGLGVTWYAGATGDFGATLLHFVVGTLIPAFAFCLIVFLWQLHLAPFELVATSKDPAEKSRKFRRVTPNYDVWRHMPSYSIEELACLIDEHEPRWATRSPRAGALIGLLIQEARIDKLKYPKGPSGPLHDPTPVLMSTRIEKEDAIEWAEAHGYQRAMAPLK